jgi:hypothetical protein
MSNEKSEIKCLKQPYLGLYRFVPFAPKQTINSNLINTRLGIKRTQLIAYKLGLRPRDCLSKSNYIKLISGKGIGGNMSDAKIIDDSVKILTNIRARPIVVDIDGVKTPTVLGSYGLFVNKDGLLMSCANTESAARQVNEVLMPKGYLYNWCKNNNALLTLRALYRTVFLIEAIYGYKAQLDAGNAQLVAFNCSNSPYFGMSMCPAIWIVNFYLLYILNPRLATLLPGWWTPIPPPVVEALQNSSNGTVPYSSVKQ